MVARIFLCHASEDKLQDREIYQYLLASWFSPRLDEEELYLARIGLSSSIRAIKAYGPLLLRYYRKAYLHIFLTIHKDRTGCKHLMTLRVRTTRSNFPWEVTWKFYQLA